MGNNNECGVGDSGLKGSRSTVTRKMEENKTEPLAASYHGLLDDTLKFP